MPLATKDLFGNYIPVCAQTEGIKYAGSKLRLLDNIGEIVGGLPQIHHVLDGFSGTTRVSQYLAQQGYRMTVNDIAIWSEVFARCYLLSSKPNKYYAEIIAHLNQLEGYDGWYSLHYGGDEGTDDKRPFQRKNTRRLDAIRDEIESLHLPWDDKCVLLTSLIQALDSVDNTMGHYVAYLANWSPRSYNNMVLKLPHRIKSEQRHCVTRGDIFEVNRSNTYDLAYFDPPYGSNNEKMPPSRVRYASYYHIWQSVILNDKPTLFGKANRREDSRDQYAASVFEEFRTADNGDFIAMQALRRLIQTTDARYILLSYSSGGRATKEELFDIINESGTLISAMEIDYKKNVMANMRWTHEWVTAESDHYEYLLLMKKK